MAENKILVFGENVTSEDYLTDAEYSANEIRKSGNIVGLARRKPNNKALKQGTLMASALAQALADDDGEWVGTEINDSLTPSGIKEIFKNYLEQKINDYTKNIKLLSDERYEYKNDENYLKNDLVTLNNNIYMAKQPNGPDSVVVSPDSTTPSGADYWKLILTGDNIISAYADINLSNISLQGKENILKYFSNIGTSERIEVIHNGIFRGENLMNYFNTMDDLYTAISNGDWSNIYIGDYVEKSFTYGGTQYTTKFRVAGINSYYNYGDTALTQYHLVMVPDNTITEQMNTSNTTSGGYVGSRMYTTVLPALLVALAGTAGTPFYGHVIPHRELFVNTVSNGVSTNWTWYDNSICLMSEQEIYGHAAWGSSGYDRGYANAQLPLFKLAPKYIATFNRTWHWLRSVDSATTFCDANLNGNAADHNASYTGGVRPRFLIG